MVKYNLLWKSDACNGRVRMVTGNSEGNDEEKLLFPSWQDHSQDTICFLLQREGILLLCVLSVNKNHQIQN